MSNENGVLDFQDRVLDFFGLKKFTRNNAVTGIELNMSYGEIPQLVVKRIDGDSWTKWEEQYEVYLHNGEVYKGLYHKTEPVKIEEQKEKTHD